jgi:sugar O-acyltransferase (sialic acid O-acetyltransferase NeuD family)
MKKVYILGAGGFGREVFQWMMETLDFQKEYSFKGFIDDDPNALNSFDLGYGIVSSVREYSFEEGDVLICGLGHPKVKRAICEPLLKAGANFLTIIHPTAKVGRGCSIGVGCVICPYATLTCDVQLGDFVLFNVMSAAGHDVQVGDWSTLSAHSDCTGGVELSESVFLGSGARIIPNKKVGRSATVGAGAVVIRDVPSEDTVFGNPARSIN